MAKTMTFGELKAALDGFTAEQLAMPARWCGEERGGPIQDVWVLEEDHVDVSGDGLEPASSYVKEELDEAGVVMFTKGTPLLLTDEGRS